mgnify:CR=1 FL=1
MTTLEEMSRLAVQATARPWNWNVSLQSKQVRLEGSPKRGVETVLDFVRWGMDGAQPRFRSADCLMVKTETLAVPVEHREHHAAWFRDIDHPDARFIVSSANSHDALLAVAMAAEAAIEHEDTRPGGPNDPGVLWREELRLKRWALRSALAALRGAQT